jgi:hypothetical protein
MKIKECHKNGEPFEDYFDELVLLFTPLINASTKRVHNKFKSYVSFHEIRSKIISILFQSIIKYDPNFKGKDENTKDFTYVYFSSFLKGKLRWDLVRLYKPSRAAYDDLCVDPRNIELNNTSVKDEAQQKLQYVNSCPVSDNFIYLCQKVAKAVSNDFVADVMLLHYGYGYKNNEIAKLYEVSSVKVSQALDELRRYWTDNKEELLEK